MTFLKVGDRVRVKKDRVDGFKQPWRGRFEKGRTGTVIALKESRFTPITVLWDHSSRAQDYDFTIKMNEIDLEVIE